MTPFSILTHPRCDDASLLFGQTRGSAPTCWVLQAILSCRDCKMRMLIAVSVRELMFVGVGFEKTRNLKLVTQNFFVPLHPEIGQDAPTVRFNALRAFNAAELRSKPCGRSSGLRPFFLRFATKAAEPSAMRFAHSMLLRSGSMPAAVQKGSFSAKLRKRQSRAKRPAAVQGASQRKKRNFVNSK